MGRRRRVCSGIYKNQRIGKLGEDAAARYLKNHGYKIIARNYAVKGGEIDLVALRRRVLVFAEVKARSSFDYGEAASRVNEEKILRIKRAAFDFLRFDGKDGEVPYYRFNMRFKLKYKEKRFDIFEVYLNDSEEVCRINHLKDSFKLKSD